MKTQGREKMKTQTERAVFWWAMVVALTAFWVGMGIMCMRAARADETATVAWDPPATRIAGGDCGVQGTALTAEEVASLEYTLSYRVRGSTGAWQNVDVNAPQATVTLPGYGVWYEFAVGARFPGGAIICPSEMLYYRTGPDTNPAGPCTNLRALIP